MSFWSEDSLGRLKQKGQNLLNKTLDQHVNLAVTGLSRSGKTAFITSLVNQLLNEGQGQPLSLFNVVHQGRFIAAKRVPQQRVYIKRFDYDGAINQFSQTPPNWPEPTSGISEMRIAVRYRPQDSLLKYATDLATLYVDITDYPGEWLLDLPMLNQSFKQWSQQMERLLTQQPRAEHAAPFLERLAQINPLAPASEELLAEIAEQYTKLLLTFRHELGLSLIQPGRFILPGDLKGAPILQFFPYTAFSTLGEQDIENAEEASLLGMLKKRFNEYKERVVKRFYKEHFAKFDRQIVLADCLTPLNNGPHSFRDLQQSISLILESFSYGQSSLLNRIFSPKIDKLLFAASKADHVTPEQHGNLVSLLKSLVFEAAQNRRYEAIEIDNMAIASVKATQNGSAQHQGNKVPVLRGKNLLSGEMSTLFPGAVPKTLPDENFWEQAQGFNFVPFVPAQALDSNAALPHLRMDRVLEFLLGDKLK